jgi:transcriptional regulator with XRE-family HTH domain
VEDQREKQLKELAESLRRLRGKTSQRDLASKLLSSKSVISRIETGRQLPSAKLCEGYEQLFDLPAGTIVNQLHRLERGDWDHQASAFPEEIPSTSTSGSSRRGRWLAVGLGLVVLGVLAATQLLDESKQAAPLRCIELGALNEELASRGDAAELQSRIGKVHRDVGAATVGCAALPTYRWHSLFVQEMALDGIPNGAILLVPTPGADLYLNRAAWGSYHQLAGFSGNMAQTIGGLPESIREFDDGHVEFALSKGAIMLAERADAPYFWIPGEYVAWWRSHPELGRPTSNPMEAVMSQEFQFGIATVTAVDPQNPRITAIDSPGSELPPIETIRDQILRQADGTSWYVTSRGQRRWLPDGGTWECAGGAERAIEGDIASYAIASLPFAGQFRC